jgi:hypothetical protein
MAKIAGTSGKEFQKAFGKDATGTLAKFLTSLGKLSKAEQLATLEALGFKDIRITRALLKLLGNTDNLTDSLKDSESGWKTNNAAQIEAQKRFETTASKLAILKANVNDAAITIGTALLPVLADLSTDAVSWIGDHQSDIEKFSKDLAGGVREAVQWAEKLDWKAIGAGLSIAADAGRALIQAFTSAPPWLQGFLITGFVANKFTGGAVMDVAGMLLSGVVKGVLGMTVGVVNINAGVVNGGGAGMAGGAAGAGGGLSGLSKVFLVGEAIGLALAVEQVRQGISADSTAHAEAIQDQTKQWLASQPPRDQLLSSLAAIDTGIADLKANPLNVLVQGDALTKLEAMRANIAAALKASPVTRNTSGSPDDRNAGAVGRGQAGGQSIDVRDEKSTKAIQRDLTAIEAQGARSYTAIENARRSADNWGRGASGAAARSQAAINATKDAARAAGIQVAAAIRDKDLSVTIRNQLTASVVVNTRKVGSGIVTDTIRSSGGDKWNNQ